MCIVMLLRLHCSSLRDLYSSYKVSVSVGGQTRLCDVYAENRCFQVP